MNWLCQHFKVVYHNTTGCGHNNSGAESPAQPSIIFVTSIYREQRTT